MSVIYRFCPQCKSDLEKHREYSYCPNCKIRIYKNSKPTAAIFPIKNGKVLLTKRAIDPFKGDYDAVGGFLNNGEDPREAAIREAKEECGLDIEPTEMLGIYVDTYGEDGDYTLNIHYIGRVIGGKTKAGDDASSLHWIDIGKVPLNGGFKNTREALKDLQKWYKSKTD